MWTDGPTARRLELRLTLAFVLGTTTMFIIFSFLRIRTKVFLVIGLFFFRLLLF